MGLGAAEIDAKKSLAPRKIEQPCLVEAEYTQSPPPIEKPGDDFHAGLIQAKQYLESQGIAAALLVP